MLVRFKFVAMGHEWSEVEIFEVRKAEDMETGVGKGDILKDPNLE